MREGSLTPQSVAEAAARAVETVRTTTPASAAEDRRVEENFDVLSTHIDGVFQLVDHDAVIPDMTRGRTEELHASGGPYVQADRVIKLLTKGQEPTHDLYRDAPTQIPGFRGSRDVKAGWEIQVNPQTKDIFDADLVTASGEKAAGYVHKMVTVTVHLDPGEDDVEGFVASTKRRLKRQGFSTEAVGQRMKVEDVVRTDEEQLLEAVDKGEVELLPGAHKVKTTGWSVVPRVISSRAEREAVEQAVLESPEAPEDPAN